MGKKEKVGLNIGGREIPMVLSTYEIEDIQKDIGCTVGQLWDEVFGIEKVMEDQEERTLFHIVEDGGKMRKFGTLVRIMGNAGLEEDGQEPDLTEKWILRHMPLRSLMKYVLGTMAIINNAMRQEAAAPKSDEPVDEVLEEENRKKEPGN